jgi:hypothetical protein
MASSAHSTEGSEATIEVLYPWYHRPLFMTHKSGCGWFPRAGNGWGTTHPIPDMAPPLLAEEERLPTKKDLKSRTNSHRPLSLLVVDVGRQDSTTNLPGPPPSPTRDGSKLPVTPPESFQKRIEFYQTLGSRKAMTGHGTTGHGHRPHTRLEVGTRVQKSVPSVPNIATLQRVHA